VGHSSNRMDHSSLRADTVVAVCPQHLNQRHAAAIRCWYSRDQPGGLLIPLWTPFGSIITVERNCSLHLTLRDHSLSPMVKTASSPSIIALSLSAYLCTPAHLRLARNTRAKAQTYRCGPANKIKWASTYRFTIAAVPAPSRELSHNQLQNQVELSQELLEPSRNQVELGELTTSPVLPQTTIFSNNTTAGDMSGISLSSPSSLSPVTHELENPLSSGVSSKNDPLSSGGSIQTDCAQYSNIPAPAPSLESRKNISRGLEAETTGKPDRTVRSKSRKMNSTIPEDDKPYFLE
jgi:hypothetical protein